MSEPWRVMPGGVELAVKVTPKAGRDAIAGTLTEADGRRWLAVKVTAPPEGGKANEAVAALLAQVLRLPGSACAVLAGLASRRKRVLLQGDPGTIARALRALPEKPGGKG